MTDAPVMEAQASTRRRRTTPFGSYVSRRVGRLQAAYLAQGHSAGETLARLRHAVGTPAGSRFDVLDVTQVSDEFLGYASGDEPTDTERAIHVAMTLYAIHQQSQRGQGMHRAGDGFGHAIGRLAIATNIEAVRRRFNALGTARAVTEIAYHARGLVRQLRDEAIPLDYGLLADDLVRAQRPDGWETTRGIWGREFYRITAERDDAQDEDAQGKRAQAKETS